MPQYKYILFKDGKPWKGMFNEVDFINAYDHAFDDLRRQMEDEAYYGEWLDDFAIARFFRRFHPTIWDPSSKGYRSLLKEYIIGANENEGSVVYGIDWEDLDSRMRSLFEFTLKEFNLFLDSLNRNRKFDKPVFGVTRGTGVLSEL